MYRYRFPLLFTYLLYFQDVRVHKEREREIIEDWETNLATFTAADESVLARN